MRCCLLLTWLAAIPRISTKCFMSLFTEISMKKYPEGKIVIRHCPEKGKETIALFWCREKKKDFIKYSAFFQAECNSALGI